MRAHPRQAGPAGIIDWLRANGQLTRTPLVVYTAAVDQADLPRLASGETRVTDLARPFDISLNSVSKHIRILERAGLVRRRRSGREHFLSFTPLPLDEAAAWIETHRTLWAARLRALDEMLQTEDAAALGKTQPARKESSR